MDGFRTLQKCIRLERAKLGVKIQKYLLCGLHVRKHAAEDGKERGSGEAAIHAHVWVGRATEP